MFSGQQISRMSEHAARKAAREGKRPYVFWSVIDVNRETVGQLPNIGDASPAGWEPLEEDDYPVDWLVDSMGFEGDGFVIGIDEVVRRIEEVVRNKQADDTIGFAITSTAQFCVTISAFRRTKEQVEGAGEAVEVEGWQCADCEDIMDEPCWCECWEDSEDACEAMLYGYDHYDADEDGKKQHALCHHDLCEGYMQPLSAWQCKGCRTLHDNEEGARHCCVQDEDRIPVV